MYVCLTIYGYVLHFYVAYIDSSPSVVLAATGPQIIGQPLTLKCTAIASECVSTIVQFVWSSGGVRLRQIEGTGFCFRYIVNSSACIDTYNISGLSTSYDGSTYQCDIKINTSPPVMATSTITLKLNGMTAMFYLGIFYLWYI